VLAFVVHQIVGTWGIAFLAAVGLTSLFDLIPDSASWKPSMRFVHWLLTENPFYPVQIMAGLYLGWRIGRHFQHKSMLWIWVLPLLACIIHKSGAPKSFFVRVNNHEMASEFG
jgi:hypothetical protein